MDCVSLEKKYLSEDQQSYYLELNGDNSFSIVHKQRPFVFNIKGLKTISIEQAEERLSKINYISKSLGPSNLIGIRNDLYCLGFSMERLISFFSSVQYKKDLIHEEIFSVLQQDQDKQYLNRKEEIELLSCFFE